MSTVADDALADGPLASDAVAATADSTIAATVAFVEAWTPSVLPRVSVVEQVKFGQALLQQWQFTGTISDRVNVVDRWIWLVAVNLVEAFDLSSEYAAYLANIITEALRLKGTVSTSFTFGLTLRERLTLLNVISAMGGLAISDGFLVDEQVIFEYFAGIGINEQMRLAGGFNDLLILHVAASSNIILDDNELLNFIYSDTITETIRADVSYVAPDGNVTTWAINSRTGAVTQYQNYAFNSFAQIGVQYLAADENGVYELDGPRDLTENVLAQMGGGYLQMNVGKMMGLKGVYLGLSGQGKGGTANWMLKLLMGDGREYIYSRISNPNMMTTKFDIGKGLRARYYAWELINQDGQDFDLDTIEFIPMVSGRRI